MKNLGQMSGMPKIRSAFSGWMSNIILLQVQQSVVDGFVQEYTEEVTFRGTVQPLSPEKINLKPEGQRSWEWLQIHTRTDTILTTNDRIKYNGVLFKVMAKLDYQQSNYIEYHAVKDYQNG